MNEITLTDVLEEYALAAPYENDSQKLARVKTLYPQFARELDDFAAARAVVKYAPEAEFSAAEKARYRELGRQNLQTVLNEISAEKTALESLIDAAKARGLNRAKFAAAIGLSVSLAQYLEKRRLEFATIPPNIIAKIADVLATGENLIADYLNQSPISAANASFKATERPEQLKPKSFAEAVREDQQLSTEEKRRLLEM